MTLPSPASIEEWRRRRPGAIEEIARRLLVSESGWAAFITASPSPAPKGTESTSAPAIERQSQQRIARKEMKRRFLALAGGASPVIVKVAGFNKASGSKRLLSYVSREGELNLENERGERLLGSGIPSQIAAEWTQVMSPRAETKDFATFTIELSFNSSAVPQAALTFAREAFDDRAFAFAATKIGASLRLKGVVVLNAGAGKRLEPSKTSAGLIAENIRGHLQDHANTVSFSFDGHGHGTRWASGHLRDLVGEHPGKVQDETGQVIVDRDAATKLVQTRWRDLAGSRTPRDMVHLVISTGPDSDYNGLEQSVRGFLAQEFRGHRYVFTIHDPIEDPKSANEGGKRPHIHAHAIITTMDDYGDRLKVWISDMDRWRSILAEHGRANNLAVETVQRVERATPRAYTYNQVRPTNFDGRTEHKGTSDHAHLRYCEKRREIPDLSAGAKSRAQAEEALGVWQELTHSNYSPDVQLHASRMINRIMRAEDWLEYRLAKQDALRSQTQANPQQQNAARGGVNPSQPVQTQEPPEHQAGPRQHAISDTYARDKSNARGATARRTYAAPDEVPKQQAGENRGHQLAEWNRPNSFETDEAPSLRERFELFFAAFKRAIDHRVTADKPVWPRFDKIPAYSEYPVRSNDPFEEKRVLLAALSAERFAPREISVNPATKAAEVDQIARSSAVTDRDPGRTPEPARLEQSRSYERGDYER